MNPLSYVHGYSPRESVRLGDQAQTLSDLLHGKSALTPEMALRIEVAFGPDMNHLLRMQLAYDVARTRRQARDLPVRRYVPELRAS